MNILILIPFLVIVEGLSAQDTVRNDYVPAVPEMVLDSIFAQEGGDTIIYKESVRPAKDTNWLPLYLLLVLPVFSIFSFIYKPYIRENWKVISNYRLTDQVIREREFANSLPGLIMLFLFCVGLGMICYVTFMNTLPDFLPGKQWSTVLILAACWPVLYLARALVYRLFIAIFHFSQPIELFRFQAMVLYETAGYILFPVLFLALTSPETVAAWSLRVCYGILGLLLILRWWSLIRTALRMSGFRFSYFFLYFCAFEAAPVLILYTYIKGETGLAL